MPTAISDLASLSRSATYAAPGAERGGKFVFKSQRVAEPHVAADLPPSLPHTSLPIPEEFEDEDGCVTGLVKLLWIKNLHTNMSCTGIDMPDTIFYRYRCPAAWFFTASDGQIKRKHKRHVSNQQIFEAFTTGLKKARGCEETIAAIHVAKQSEEDEWPPRTKVEHLTVAELREFLFRRDKTDDGLLQRFVPPLHSQNHTLTVMWSPEIVMMERRLNVESLTDVRARTTLHRRTLTLEDEAGASMCAPIKGGLLGERLRASCERVVRHAAAISAYRMRFTRLVLHFKVDARDRLR